MKPLLKWVGGKTQILKCILDSLPSRIKNYHEPFLGGGSVLIAILTSGRILVEGTVTASDINEELIGFYNCVKTNHSALIHTLHDLICAYTSCQEFNGNKRPTTLSEGLTSRESFYYWIRGQYNQKCKASIESEQTERAAMFWFLNKTCFRGLHRIGPNGFNVPFGNYKTLPSFPTEDELAKYSELFANVNFVCQGFDKAIENVTPGDTVYMDPPYAPVDRASFVNYTKDGFSQAQHELLFSSLKSMRDKGVKCIMSNADVKMVRDAFEGWTILTVVARRAINSKSPESVQNEVIIS